MGDIAEMMTDGTLCEGCGVVLRGTAEGFPRYCSAQCTPPEVLAGHRGLKRPKVSCPTCGKRVQAQGLADHQRDAHRP